MITSDRSRILIVSNTVIDNVIDVNYDVDIFINNTYVIDNVIDKIYVIDNVIDNFIDKFISITVECETRQCF